MKTILTFALCIICAFSLPAYVTAGNDSQCTREFSFSFIFDRDYEMEIETFKSCSSELGGWFEHVPQFRFPEVEQFELVYVQVVPEHIINQSYIDIQPLLGCCLHQNINHVVRTYSANMWNGNSWVCIRYDHWNALQCFSCGHHERLSFWGSTPGCGRAC